METEEMGKTEGTVGTDKMMGMWDHAIRPHDTNHDG